MNDVMAFWEEMRPGLGALVDRLHDIPLGLALAVAALACVVAFLLLVSRLRAWRAYGRVQAERDDLKEQLAALQVKYDGEVHWRTATEKFNSPQAQKDGAAQPAAGP